MPAGTIAIVLIAAIAHAVWNTVSKYKRGDTVVFVWAYTAASALLCVPVSFILIATHVTPQVSWLLIASAAVSAILHMTYSLTLQTGYDRSDFGVVYPIARGTGPVLTMGLAILLLGERPAPLAIFGALVVVGGIVIVTGNPFRTGAHRPLQGVIWGGGTGAAIAGYTLWDSYAIVSLHLAPITYFAGTLLLQSVILTCTVAGRRQHIGATLRADAAPISAIAVLSPLAYILVLVAMQTSPVALVAPLRESSIVIGSLLAWKLFHETSLARRVTGAGIVLAGIAAISL